MAATVEGAFVILDRATGPIRKIRREAEMTDKVIRQLGDDMDQIGSNQQMRGFEKAQRSLGNFGREAQTSRKAMAGLGGESDTLTRKLGRMGAALAGVGKLIRPAIFLGLASAIATATQAVGALAGGVVALLPKLTDLVGLAGAAPATFTGLGLAVVTAKLAFKGLGEALGGNEEAMKRLTPRAQEFVRTLKGMSPIMDRLREAAQKDLFSGLTSSLQRLRRGVPVAERLLRGMGRTLGDLAERAAGRFTRKGFLGDFEALGKQGTAVVDRMGRGLINLVDALRHVGMAARPLTNWMTKLTLGWTKSAREAAELGRESGAMGDYFDRVRKSAEQMGRIIGNLWGTFRNLGRAARPLGNDLWRDIEGATERWEDFTGSVTGQRELRAYFMRLREPIREIGGLVGDLGMAIMRLGASPGLTQTARSLREAVPHLEKLFGTLGADVSPALADLLGEVIRLINNLPLKLIGQMVRLLANVLGAVNDLIDRFPVLGNVIGSVLAVGGIVKMIGWVKKLSGAWRGVSTAMSGALLGGKRAPGTTGPTVAPVPTTTAPARGGVRGLLTRGAGLLKGGGPLMAIGSGVSGVLGATETPTTQPRTVTSSGSLGSATVREPGWTHQLRERAASAFSGATFGLMDRDKLNEKFMAAEQTGADIATGGGGLPGKILRGFAGLPAKIGAFVKKIPGFFRELPGKIWGFIKSIPGFFLKIAQKIPGLLLKGVMQIPRIIAKAVTFVATLPVRIVELIWKAAQKIGPLIGKGVQRAWEFIKKLPGFFREAGEDAIGFVGRTAGKVVGFFKALPGRIWGFVKTIPRRIGDAFGKLSAIARTAVMGGDDGKGGILGFFRMLPSKILTALGGLARMLKDFFVRVAAQAIQGMLEGMPPGMRGATEKLLGLSGGESGGTVGRMGISPGPLVGPGRGDRLTPKGGTRGGQHGGIVRGFAVGGPVPPSPRDTVPAMLEPGEFVVRREAVESVGTPYMESLNQGFAGGGAVAGISGRAGEKGKRSIGRATQEWAKEMERGKPRIFKHVSDLERDTDRSFGRTQRNVKRKTQDTQRDTQRQWKRTRDAVVGSADEAERGASRSLDVTRRNVSRDNAIIERDTERKWTSARVSMSRNADTAKKEVTRNFAALKQEALKALAEMGVKGGDAQQALKGASGVGAGADSVAGGGKGAKGGAAAAGTAGGTRAARGARIPGFGLQDTVPIAPNALAAPGELIVNRHTEDRIDKLLRLHGTSTGSEVARERRPHSAPRNRPGMPGFHEDAAYGLRFIGVTRHAKGGRAAASSGGIVALGKQLQSQGYDVAEHPAFGGVQGGHSPGSYHYKGMAIDVNADSMPGGEKANLDRLNARLKGMPGVVELLWQVADHFDHLHVAMSGGGGPINLGGAAGAGMEPIKLKGRKSRLRGVPGALSNRATEALRGKLEENINQNAMAGAGAAVAGAGGKGQVMAWLTQALKITGHYSPSNLAGLYKQAMSESGGDPNAQNNSDSNAAAGTPSIGLLQTIEPTFRAHAMRGMSNIRNPVHNAVAAIRYMFARYGHIVSTGSGYELGGRIPYSNPLGAMTGGGGKVDFGGWFGDGGSMTARRPTLIGVGEKGPENVTVSPVNQTSTHKSGGQRIEVGGITVNYNGPGDVTRRVKDEIGRAFREFEQEMNTQPLTRREDATLR